MYVCGPNLYGPAHIGHALSYIIFDTFKRHLIFRGYQVRHVQNFTDIEDRIIETARVQDTTIEALAEKYIQRFLGEMKDLNILPADLYPRATSSIPTIIEMNQGLIAKGYAYTVDGDVYFRVRADEDYGKLSHRTLDEMQAGARVAVDERKEDPLDFVLWKSAKPGEPSWESPWGPGRPGWHIECSAMALDVFGPRLDIHTGGVDLVFPHHENEIAQSEGALGGPWVNYWVHGEFLMVEGEKMSKSLGNFFTLRDLVTKGFDPITFRFAILSNHYRKLYNFSFDGLRAAKATLERLRTFRLRMEEPPGSPREGAAASTVDPRARLAQAHDEIWRAMADDLNPPEALAAILTLVTDINARDDARPLDRGERDEVIALLDEADRIFAAWPHEARASADADIEARIEARRQAKAARNWAEADRLRDELKAMGIVLEDRKDGTVRWKRAEK